MEKKEEKIFRDIVKILEQDVPQEALAEGNPTPEQEAIALIKQELDKAREEGKGRKLQGWECPKCGSVYSPLTFECPTCKNSGIKVRTSDRTSGYDNTSYLN